MRWGLPKIKIMYDKVTFTPLYDLSGFQSQIDRLNERLEMLEERNKELQGVVDWNYRLNRLNPPPDTISDWVYPDTTASIWVSPNATASIIWDGVPNVKS